MNAAAKVIQQGGLFSGHITSMEWGGNTRLIALLVSLILLSALGVVYLTNESRLAFIELQQLEQQSNAMQLHRGQLLLEKASFMSAARIEVAAVERLKMHSPMQQRTLKSQVA